MLRHNKSGIERHLSADEYLSEEAITVDDWYLFGKQVQEKMTAITAAVKSAFVAGKIVCAFGASAKCTVMINACGLEEEGISFVTDNSPLKPGRLIPGTSIPIIPQEQMLSEHPDYALLAAWNYRQEILESQSKWRSRGGKFIIPTATGVEIV
jgi:methylation protein EvaC